MADERGNGRRDERRLVAENRRAYHEYFVLERIETGIELTGTEVKSLRAGKVNMGDSFASVDKGEVWVQKLHISPYEQGNRYNVDPLRRRRLLLKRGEIERLYGKTREKGLTLIPLQLYFKGNWAKLELGLVKGKQLYDKREALHAKEASREIERALKQRLR